MKHLSVIGIVTAALISGATSYIFARYPSSEPAAQARQPMSQLLTLSAQQEQAINEAAPSFQTDAARLASDLDAVQENLACMLDDPAIDRQEAMATVEKMMLAHNALERRVAEHVLEVREHLEPQQRKALMGLMAERVRDTQNRMQRCRWGWGRGTGSGSGSGSGRGSGGGQGGGNGRGGRNGPRDGTGPRNTE